jgi:hypothetical protein
VHVELRVTDKNGVVGISDEDVVPAPCLAEEAPSGITNHPAGDTSAEEEVIPPDGMVEKVAAGVTKHHRNAGVGVEEIVAATRVTAHVLASVAEEKKDIRNPAAQLIVSAGGMLAQFTRYIAKNTMSTALLHLQIEELGASLLMIAEIAIEVADKSYHRAPPIFSCSPSWEPRNFIDERGLIINPQQLLQGAKTQAQQFGEWQIFEKQITARLYARMGGGRPSGPWRVSLHAVLVEHSSQAASLRPGRGMRFRARYP